MIMIIGIVLLMMIMMIMLAMIRFIIMVRIIMTPVKIIVMGLALKCKMQSTSLWRAGGLGWLQADFVPLQSKSWIQITSGTIT